MPTPIPYDALITSSTELVSDFGMLGVLVATMVISLAGYLLKRMRSAAR